jgi:GDP-4-dehydro-6-deoxy-D-mannose reductase
VESILVRILITGVSGFVGTHLAAHLLETVPNVEIHGTVLGDLPPRFPAAIICHPINLKREQDTAQLVAEVRPDQIYHLAASAIVHRSFDAPWETLENNIRIQLNVILGCLDAEIAPRMLVISSGEVYGVDQPNDQPTTEDAPFRPANPYGVSKVTQDVLALQYFLSHQLPIMRARPFNHLGPGQGLGFATTDFASQIAKIEIGLQEPVMRVGELSAERDFTDVRDTVRAYRLIVEQGTPGEVYNVASGQTYSIRYILNTLLSYSMAEIQVQSNTAGLHSSGVRRSWGDSRRLRQATGWQPVIAIEETLRDVLEDWRQRVQLPSKE